MAAKRFTITQDFEEHHRQIRDNGKIIMGCFIEPQAEPIVKLLNGLHEENEQLKLNNKRYMLMVNANSDLNDEIYEQLKKTEKKVKELHEENQALKKEMGDLGTVHAEEINKIEDEFDEEILKLEKENEQCKMMIATLRNIILENGIDFE